MTVTLIAAQSLDGFITRHEEPGTGFTSAADQAWLAAALAQFDATILGRRTYEIARPWLRQRLTPSRLRLVWTRSPEAWQDDAVPGQLEFAHGSPAALLKRLAIAGRQRCALLGGAEVHAAFAEADLIDAWWVTVEPHVFGAGRPLCPGVRDVPLRLEGVERLPDSDSVLLRYRRASRPAPALLDPVHP